ncbi:uncharacterized protein LOC132047807 [Lycium ferocissimum]|uniref:uncharacterized protein LOC132047807 n=1 Tax=Lycium ferocissimum TaxID=112874 RepID=UPI00281676B4|nr:uncharacterized protein LOC132047807 [Lycium ferocissimum]
MPQSVQNCNFCDRDELSIYREDNIMNYWDWSSYGEREDVFYVECKIDYMLEKLNRVDDDEDGHSPELLESVVTPWELKFNCLKKCRIMAKVVCNMLGICEDSASAVAEQVSTFAIQQLNDPQNTGCKVVLIVMWFTIFYVQHDGEGLNDARARVNTIFPFRQLPPIVPPPNPTTRSVNPSDFQVAVYRWTLKHGDPILPMCSVYMDEPSIGETIAILPCWHYFHLHCIIKWLEINNRCPVCRWAFPKNGK